MTDKKRQDEFHAHEALDRVYVQAQQFGQFIEDHSYISTNPDLAKKAKQIGEDLGELYQMIGALSLSPDAATQTEPEPPLPHASYQPHIHR